MNCRNSSICIVRLIADANLPDSYINLLMNHFKITIRKILDSAAGILLFIVSLAAFYMPYEIRIIPAVAQALPMARYILGGLLLIVFFLLYGSSLTVFRGNWALWAAAGFVGVLIFSTVMNGGDLEGALGTYGLAGLFLVMDIAVFFKVNPKKYLLIAFFLLLLVNIANTYTVYEYCLKRGTGMWESYGLYTNWFYSLIGNYNGGIEYVLPMAICGSAYAHRYGKWLDLINYPAVIMSLIMAVSCDSATQILVFAALLVFMAIGNLAMAFRGFAGFLKVVFQPVIFIAVDFAILVSVVIINKSNWVARIGLDPDFHNRRHVWNMSMEWIARNPIWGSGQETVGVEASKITGYAHSHCTYLEAAYKTGFIGCVFLLLMMAAAIVAIYRSRHHRISYMMTVMLFLMGLAGVAETYPMVYVMFCLGLIYYIAKNTNDTESAKKRVHKEKTGPLQQEDPAADTAAVPEKERTAAASQPARSKMHQEKDASVPQSAYDIQEVQLEHVGKKVQEVQDGPESPEPSEPELDSTVHIDETVLLKEEDNEP